MLEQQNKEPAVSVSNIMYAPNEASRVGQSKYSTSCVAPYAFKYGSIGLHNITLN